MARITRYSDWGGWYQLDGRTLQNGEQLRLTWPDGSEETVTIAVVDLGMDISDHGQSYRGQDVRAYVDFDHHGATARVPIVGLDAERITAPADTPLGPRMTRMTFTGTVACPGCKDGRLNCLVHRPLPDQVRIVILGGPKTGKTTLAGRLRVEVMEHVGRVHVPVRHTDDLIHLGWSEASQHVADEWLTQPGPWIIEGVAAVRALRKWRDAHPGEPPPVDRVIRLTVPHVALTPCQRTMARGEETVWQDIAGWLYLSGVPRAEQVEIICEHPGYNGIAKLE